MTKFAHLSKIACDGSRNDFYIKLNEYSNILTENDNLLIYYAGHGDVDPNTNFLDITIEPMVKTYKANFTNNYTEIIQAFSET